MCRIWGISYGDNPEPLTTPEIAGILFPALVAQGPHAFGWMSYDAVSNETTWTKYVGRCDEPANVAEIKREVPQGVRWIVGHTRFATHGSPSNLQNNHPIPHGNFIGVHNGVLRNHESILKVTGREEEGTEVDSEAIFAAVNKWGVLEGIRKIEGDMVTLFAKFDYPETLYLARTHGRQITLGWTQNGNLIFASQEDALHKLEAHGIKFTKFSVVSENRLLEIRKGKIMKRTTFREPYKFTPQRGVVVTSRPPVGATTGTALSRYQSKDEKEESVAAMINADRASRRGEILFPKGRPRRKQQGLFYVDGVFLTKDEYEKYLDERRLSS